jgi:hypothetical protein
MDAQVARGLRSSIDRAEAMNGAQRSNEFARLADEVQRSAASSRNAKKVTKVSETLKALAGSPMMGSR